MFCNFANFLSKFIQLGEVKPRNASPFPKAVQGESSGENTCIHHKSNSVVRVFHCAASQQQTLDASARLLLIRFLSAARENENPFYCQILLDFHYC